MSTTERSTRTTYIFASRCTLLAPNHRVVNYNYGLGSVVKAKLIDLQSKNFQSCLSGLHCEQRGNKQRDKGNLCMLRKVQLNNNPRLHGVTGCLTSVMFFRFNSDCELVF